MTPVLDRALLYARTLRYLSPLQVMSYGLHAARRRVAPWVGPLMGAPLTAMAHMGAPSLAALTALGEAVPHMLPLGEPERERARELLRGRVTHLGRARDFGGAISWDHAADGRLWLYHLHYLDELVPLAAMAAFGDDEALAGIGRLLLDWRVRNRVGRGAGWEPYPISLRVQNLARAAGLLHVAGRFTPSPLAELVLSEMGRQATWLAMSLEHHLRANHLLANLTALVTATAVLPRHPVLEALRPWHRAQLARQIDEQILPDGGHYERSPMYHALVTGSLCELVTVLSARTDSDGLHARAAAAAVRATRFLETIRHPDGGLPHFNDSTQSEPYLADFARVFAAERTGSRQLAWPGRAVRLLPSGYVVLRAPERHLVLDCGPVGPDHQPGHAHADILSFELSVGAERVIVNAGVRGYADDPTRAFSRSTEAHSTVRIGDYDQVELWSSFRVARRAVPELVTAEERGGLAVSEGRYRWPHVPGRPVHARAVALGPRGDLLLADTVRGAGAHTVRSTLHLHPDVAVEPDHGALLLTLPSGRRLTLSFCGAALERSRAPYFPRFGEQRDGELLTLTCVGDARIAVALTESGARCKAQEDGAHVAGVTLRWPG